MKELTRVRCGVIGLGMVGREHADILSRLPEAELVAACDLDPSRTGGLGAGVTVAPDAAALLRRDGLDAVWVCTPQAAHAPIVVDALERGLAVFCEKPIAADHGAADLMIEAARRTGGLLAVGHTLRFHPDLQALRRMVADGGIGDVVQAAARWATSDREGAVISGRTSVPLEMAIHHLDVLRWLMGEIDEVVAMASALTPCGPGPDAVSGLARFASGAVATLEHNWVMPAASGVHSDHKVTLFGTLGTAYFDAHQPFSRAYAVTGPRLAHTAYRAGDSAVPSGALSLADRHFLGCVRSELDWPVTLADARRALELALAMDTSAAGRVRHAD
jgi:predicted dehydrogenase